jgi:DNA-binding response OmpR family regulator
MKLLIIEDNRSLVANLFEYFEARGHVLDAAPDGLTGMHLALNGDYDAIVLDLMLPRIDGVELCRKLRLDGRLQTPLVMLTARDSLGDKLLGFEAGADDYLTKPFALSELEARLTSLVRRVQQGAVPDALLRVGDLSFDPATMKIERAGTEIHLNPACRSLLALLMRESPRLVTRQRMERELWGDDPPDDDLLRSHIYTLRKAIDRPFQHAMLVTVQKSGYRLDPAHG